MQNIFVEFLPPWVETGLQPAFYDKESGTVLQQVARMYAKVNYLVEMFNQFSKDTADFVNEFVDDTNTEIARFEHDTTETVNEYIAKFVALKDFVDDYFDNLDVQEEINNKLDDMVEQGTLQEIITTYIQSNVAWTFDTVADMKLATNLVNGSFAQTLGFHTINDGGGATYYITDTGTANEMDVIAVGNLRANLVKTSSMTPEMFGAYGDGTHDDHDSIERGLLINGVLNFIQSKTYKVNSSVTINYNNILNGNNALFKGDTESSYPIFTVNGDSAPASRTKILIQDMRIECGSGINDRVHEGIKFIHAADFVIKNVFVRYATYGFHFQNSLLFTFENCHVQNTNVALYNDAVNLTTCNNVKFDKCVFVANKYVINSVNFAFKNALFVNCEIEANDSDGDAVIIVPEANSGTGGSSLIFDSCWFEANTPCDIKANVDYYNPISVTNCFITHPANTATCFAISDNENFSMVLDRCQDLSTYINNGTTINSESNHVIIQNCRSRLSASQLGSAKGIYDNFGIKNKQSIMDINVIQNGSNNVGRIEGSSNYMNLRSNTMNGIRFVDCSYQKPIIFGGGNAYMWINGNNLYAKVGSAPASGTDGTLIVGS